MHARCQRLGSANPGLSFECRAACPHLRRAWTNCAQLCAVPGPGHICTDSWEPDDPSGPPLSARDRLFHICAGTVRILACATWCTSRCEAEPSRPSLQCVILRSHASSQLATSPSLRQANVRGTRSDLKVRLVQDSPVGYAQLGRDVTLGISLPSGAQTSDGTLRKSDEEGASEPVSGCSLESPSAPTVGDVEVPLACSSLGSKRAALGGAPTSDGAAASDRQPATESAPSETAPTFPAAPLQASRRKGTPEHGEFDPSSTQEFVVGTTVEVIHSK
jgi:hypothetical protein